MTGIEPGYNEGDLCNREGCTGIIEHQGKEGCCSCHINPPCSYCETPDEYCPKCEWDAQEEQRQQYMEKQQRQKALHLEKANKIAKLNQELADASERHKSLSRASEYTSGWIIHVACSGNEVFESVRDDKVSRAMIEAGLSVLRLQIHKLENDISDLLQTR